MHQLDAASLAEMRVGKVIRAAGRTDREILALRRSHSFDPLITKSAMISGILLPLRGPSTAPDTCPYAESLSPRITSRRAPWTTRARHGAAAQPCLTSISITVVCGSTRATVSSFSNVIAQPRFEAMPLATVAYELDARCANSFVSWARLMTRRMRIGYKH